MYPEATHARRWGTPTSIITDSLRTVKKEMEEESNENQ